MDVSSTSCAACSAQPAAVFCTCLVPEVCLCSECFATHSLGDSQQHKHFPIATLQLHRNSLHSARVTAFETLREQTLHYDSEIDKAIAALKEQVQQVIENLKILCGQKVAELTALKAKIQREVAEGLEEVEATLNQDQPQLATEFGRNLRESIEKTLDLAVFSYSIKTQPVECIVSLQYRLSGLALQEYFPSVHNSTLTLYHLATRKTSQHSLSVNFRDGGGYAMLDSCHLLCVGSYPYSAAVHSLDLTTVTMTQLAPLPAPRGYAGVAKLGSFAYVFGGRERFNVSMHSCWKLNLGEEQWQSVGNMTYPRSSFNPCVFRSLVYLVGAVIGNKGVELFSPQTETFTVLSLSLPLEVKATSVVFIAKNELCVLTTNRRMARWKIDEEENFRLSVTDKPCWSSQQPLVVNSKALIAAKGGVVQFNLVTYTFI